MIEPVARSASRLLQSTALLLPLTILFCAAVWVANTRHLDAVVAWGGWSAIDWMNQRTLAGQFTANFASGIEAYGKSAFMQLCALVAAATGVPPEALLPATVALEIALMAFATFALARAVFPQAPITVPLLAVLLTIGGNAQFLELARFGRPFNGLYYNAAEAVRLLALALLLRGRTVPAFAVLALSFATHPVLGAIGLVFAATMLVARPASFRIREALAAGAAFAIPAVAWLAFQYRGANIGGGGISGDEWFSLTRLFNFHWYPVSYGLFTTGHAERFVSFLAFLLLCAHYAGRSGWRELDRRVWTGVVALLALVAAGVAASAFELSPALVKLSLHRASDLVVVLGTIYIVAGAWQDFSDGRPWTAALACAALLSPFLFRPGFPLLLSLLLVVAGLRSGHGAPTRSGIVAAAGAIACVGLMAWYGAAGWLGPWDTPAYTGGARLALVVAAFALVAWALHRLDARSLVPAAALVLIGAVASIWVRHEGPDSEIVRNGAQFKEVQLWAREHTPPDALFMVDPTIYYGWRDFSQRSSFGNLREWLHTAWLYDTRGDRFEDGRGRFAEFGIALDPYLDARPPLAGAARLGAAVQRRYYEAGDGWRRDLAVRRGIDYFVFIKSHMRSPTGLPVAYENAAFLVAASGRPRTP